MSLKYSARDMLYCFRSVQFRLSPRAHGARSSTREGPSAVGLSCMAWVRCLARPAGMVPASRPGSELRRGGAGARARRGLVVSVATPGQGGLGHVNEREHADVLAVLRATAPHLVVDERAQARLRAAARFSWFRANTIVLRVAPPPAVARRLPPAGPPSA